MHGQGQSDRLLWSEGPSAANYRFQHLKSSVNGPGDSRTRGLSTTQSCEESKGPAAKVMCPRCRLLFQEDVWEQHVQQCAGGAGAAKAVSPSDASMDFGTTVK